MESLIHADIFFFLTSIAIIVAIIILVLAGWYLVQTLRNVRDISYKLNRVAGVAEEDFHHVHARFKDTWLGAMLFGKKEKPRSKKRSTEN